MTLDPIAALIIEDVCMKRGVSTKSVLEYKRLRKIEDARREIIHNMADAVTPDGSPRWSQVEIARALNVTRQAVNFVLEKRRLAKA